jgi:hypothetical protein
MHHRVDVALTMTRGVGGRREKVLASMEMDVACSPYPPSHSYGEWVVAEF